MFHKLRLVAQQSVGGAVAEAVLAPLVSRRRPKCARLNIVLWALLIIFYFENDSFTRDILLMALDRL